MIGRLATPARRLVGLDFATLLREGSKAGGWAFAAHESPAHRTPHAEPRMGTPHNHIRARRSTKSRNRFGNTGTSSGTTLDSMVMA